jgi:hypothetical protein
MKLRPFHAALAPACCFAFACCFALTLHSQTPTPAPTHVPPAPLKEQAPGAAPDKVWYNAASKVYHCLNDRYYGRTREGKYMSEAEAKATGAHGPRGKNCFK